MDHRTSQSASAVIGHQKAENASPELPSEAQRTEAYNAELMRRYLNGQYLSAADKREAKELIEATKRAAR